MIDDTWREDDVLAAWSALLRLHARLVPKIEADVERATGTPLRWYDVLLELANAPDGRMRMQDLGDAVVLSRTRVSRVVDELVTAGLVERIPNPEDGRSAFACITPAGRRVFRRTAPIYLKRVRTELTAHVRERDFAALRRILEAALGQ